MKECRYHSHILHTHTSWHYEVAVKFGVIKGDRWLRENSSVRVIGPECCVSQYGNGTSQVWGNRNR